MLEIQHPLIFIGGTFGLAISKILAFIPQGVGVTAGMAGVTAAAFPIPLSVTLMLGMLGGQPDLTPAIAIGAVTGYVVSKALSPYLPKPQAESTSSGEPT
jgi:H+/Cl- antiporter ClcA